MGFFNNALSLCWLPSCGFWNTHNVWWGDVLKMKMSSNNNGFWKSFPMPLMCCHFLLKNIRERNWDVRYVFLIVIRTCICTAGEFDELTVVEIRSCQDVGFEETKTHASLISCWEPALKFRCCFMMSKRPFWFSGRRTRSTKNYSKASITSETMVCFKKFNSVIATYPCFVLGLGKKRSSLKCW